MGNVFDPNEDVYDSDEDDTCQRCGGEGGYHDCGEDTCCCEDPDGLEDWVTCEDCNGTGAE